jgi:hypothetical protein
MNIKSQHLKLALADKEKYQHLLFRLEHALQDGRVTAEQYDQVKAEYQSKVTAAVTSVANIKASIRQEVSFSQEHIQNIRKSIEQLAARRNVKEISGLEYARQQTKLKRELASLERLSDRLNGLLAAKSVSDIKNSIQTVSAWAPVSLVQPRELLMVNRGLVILAGLLAMAGILLPLGTRPMLGTSGYGEAGTAYIWLLAPALIILAAFLKPTLVCATGLITLGTLPLLALAAIATLKILSGSGTDPINQFLEMALRMGPGVWVFVSGILLTLGLGIAFIIQSARKASAG